MVVLRIIHPFPRCLKPARESRLSKLAFSCQRAFRRRRRTRLTTAYLTCLFLHSDLVCNATLGPRTKSTQFDRGKCLHVFAFSCTLYFAKALYYHRTYNGVSNTLRSVRNWRHCSIFGSALPRIARRSGARLSIRSSLS